MRHRAKESERERNREHFATAQKNSYQRTSQPSGLLSTRCFMIWEEIRQQDRLGGKEEVLEWESRC